MNNTTRNILILGSAALLIGGGLVFYMAGQKQENKNIFGRTKAAGGRMRPITQTEMNQFLQAATSSNTARNKGIPNQPSEAERRNLIAVAENVYFPLVRGLGVIPKISSGYRSFALNKAVGGSSSSQHMKGEAIDIKLDPNGHDNNDIWRFIKDYTDFDQMILEFNKNNRPSWIHVSFKRGGGNRRKMNIAQNVGGKTKYWTFSEKKFEDIYGYAA